MDISGSPRLAGRRRTIGHVDFASIPEEITSAGLTRGRHHSGQPSHLGSSKRTQINSKPTHHSHTNTHTRSPVYSNTHSHSHTTNTTTNTGQLSGSTEGLRDLRLDPDAARDSLLDSPMESCEDYAEDVVLGSKESLSLYTASDDQSDLSDSDSGFSGSNKEDVSVAAEQQWDVRKRSTLMGEAKDQTYRRLKEELKRAQDELQLKDQECVKLERVRDQMEQELEELTASLFEEANKMVQEANVKRMHTEKLLNEAQSSIEVLNAEVQALKALVLTSTPSEPNRHLHPQLDRKASKEAPADSSLSKKLSFKKTHKRSTSHHITKANPDFVFDATKPAPGPPVTNTITDTQSFECFKKWRDNPTLSHDNSFISRVMNDDVIPCLSFANKQLADRLLGQCETNNILIEPIPSSLQSNRNCALMLRECLCSYKLRFADGELWQEICELVRNRIIAVCELFTYLGYVKNGLIKNSSDTDMYWHIMDLCKAISLARLGFKS